MNDFKHISIIGTGLIGASLALALKKNGFQGKITGIGRNEVNLARAEARGIIDDHTTDQAEGAGRADLVVLASPVGTFGSIMKEIRNNLRPGTIVTDVGSVKDGVIRSVEPLIPDGVAFVAGHPIAGKETSGIDDAEAELFQKARCIITPTPQTDPEAMKRIMSLWETIGAHVVQMSPEEHDFIFAAVSHLPHVIAYALVNAIDDMGTDFIKNSGGGLKDMTRIALSPATLWRDIIQCNRENILKTLNGFSQSISTMTRLIEDSDWPGLEKEFVKARESRGHIE